MKTFTIAAVPSLQSLTLITSNDEYQLAYVINFPSLKYLYLQGFAEDDSCLIENTPELVEANITDVCGLIYEKIHGSLTSVKRLSSEIASPLDLVMLIFLLSFLLLLHCVCVINTASRDVVLCVRMLTYSMADIMGMVKKILIEDL